MDKDRCRRGFIKGRRWGTIPKFQTGEGKNEACLLPFGHNSAHVIHHGDHLLCFSDSGTVVGDTEQARVTLNKQRGVA